MDVGGIRLNVSDLPESVAWRAMYLENGVETELDHRVMLQAHSQGSLYLPIQSGDLRPGKHRGMIRLIPDPDAAYEDPQIESIWGGTLEFPLDFEKDSYENR